MAGTKIWNSVEKAVKGVDEEEGTVDTVLVALRKCTLLRLRLGKEGRAHARRGRGKRNTYAWYLRGS